MSTHSTYTRLRRGLIAGLVGLAMALTSIAPASAAEDEVDIPDNAFRACVLRQLEASDLPGHLTVDNLAALKKLNCVAELDGTVEDLTGLAHLTSLESFGLVRGHRVADLSPIGEVPTLRSLALGLDSSVNRSFPEALDLGLLSFLVTGANLPHLPPIRASEFTISGPDLNSLSGLQKVTARKITIVAGRLTDASALASATTESLRLFLGAQPRLDGLTEIRDLETLLLHSPDLTDLSGLADHPTLRSLDLVSPTLTDLASLGSPSRLTSLLLMTPELTSLGPSGALRHLTKLQASGAKLTSIEALAGTMSLMDADLYANQISDISPLRTVPDGASLDLDRNRIPDFSPLAGWKGTLKATLQQIQLPDGVSEVPYRIPFPLRDPQGRELVLSETSIARYADGYLTFDRPNESAAAYFWDAANPADMTIAVVLTQQVKPAQKFVTQQPVFTTTPRVGVRFTPTLPAWTPTPGTTSYQWYNWGVPIEGATETSYVPIPSDVGGPLSLRVTGKKPGYATTEVFSDFSDFVAAAGDYRVPTPNLRYSGRLATGTVLSVESGTWDVGVTLKYQWQRDKKDITGATSPTYKVRASDVGHSLRVRVTGSVPGFGSVTTYSAGDIAVKARFAASSKPKITGTRAVGKKLLAAVDWTPATKLAYQWYRNGKKIKGATKVSYTPKAADLNDRFSVRVTASKSGYTTVAKTSARTAKIKPGTLAPGSATISGVATVGKKLTATSTGWGPGKVSLSYRWYRDGKAIRNATARSYQVKKSDAGHRLSVRVTGKKPGYTTKTVKSAAVTASAA